MERMPQQTRKRILMFYFAAGINIVMAMWVASVGSGQVSGGLLGLIVAVFLGFAWVNFYVAKTLRKKWEANMRQRVASAGQANEP